VLIDPAQKPKDEVAFRLHVRVRRHCRLATKRNSRWSGRRRGRLRQRQDPVHQPTGQGLVGKRVGDRVEIEVPRASSGSRFLEIRYEGSREATGGLVGVDAIVAQQGAAPLSLSPLVPAGDTSNPQWASMRNRGLRTVRARPTVNCDAQRQPRRTQSRRCRASHGPISHVTSTRRTSKGFKVERVRGEQGFENVFLPIVGLQSELHLRDIHLPRVQLEKRHMQVSLAPERRQVGGGLCLPSQSRTGPCAPCRRSPQSPWLAHRSLCRTWRTHPRRPFRRREPCSSRPIGSLQSGMLTATIHNTIAIMTRQSTDADLSILGNTRARRTMPAKKARHPRAAPRPWSRLCSVTASVVEGF